MKERRIITDTQQIDDPQQLFDSVVGFVSMQ